MLAYECKQCGRIIIAGYKNEFDEYFCSEDCYKKYCESHHYAEHLDRLEQIKTALD